MVSRSPDSVAQMLASDWAEVEEADFEEAEPIAAERGPVVAGNALVAADTAPVAAERGPVVADSEPVVADSEPVAQTELELDSMDQACLTEAVLHNCYRAG